MQRCTMSLAIREMQIKITRYYSTLTRTAKVKNSDDIKFMRMWKNWIIHTLLVGMWNGIVILEYNLCVFLKRKHEIWKILTVYSNLIQSTWREMIIFIQGLIFYLLPQKKNSSCVFLICCCLIYLALWEKGLFHIIHIFR